MYKTIDDYPMLLTAPHIAEILMVSNPTAYQLMEQTTFPLIRLGRNKRVGKYESFKWLSLQQVHQL